MEFNLNLPIKKGDTVYTIENYKAEMFYVVSIRINVKDLLVHRVSSDNITLKLDRYEEHENSYVIKRNLSQCFISKNDLINQL